MGKYADISKKIKNKMAIPTPVNWNKCISISLFTSIGWFAVDNHCQEVSQQQTVFDSQRYCKY